MQSGWCTVSRERTLKLEKFGIDRNEYLRMRYMCLGYEKRKSLQNDAYSIQSPAFGGGGHSGSVSQPTERRADVAMRNSQENDLIDSCIRKVCEANQMPRAEKFLRLHVTTTYAKKYQLIDLYQMGIEWHIFAKMRTEFYVELARRLNFI